MRNESLANLIEQRIDSAYGGNQAAFARAVEMKPQTLNTILKGRVTLPQADVRRRLSQELGIPHVQFFVMAGELRDEELETAGVQGVVQPGPKAHVHAIVDQFEWDQRNANRVGQIIQTLMRVDEVEG